MRFLAFMFAVLMLVACQVVYIPIPVDVTGTRAVLEDIAEYGPVEGQRQFTTLYGALDEPYLPLRLLLEQPAFGDPSWRAAVAQLAGEWRAAIEALQEMEQPAGAAWARGWPTLQAGLAEYHYAAGAIESAANANDPSLLEPVRARIINGANLIGEAMRLLGGE